MTFMDTLIDNNAELASENGELKRKISELKEENARLSRVLRIAADRENTCRTRCDFLLKENSRLSCLISSKEDRINELENKCDEYAEANNDLGERLAKLEKEYERLGKHNKTLCASNDMLHSSNRVLKLEIEKLNSRNTTLENDNKVKEEQIEKLGKSNRELSNKAYLLECEKTMSNFTKIFAGGEADCSKCVCREESEKKDKRIEELVEQNKKFRGCINDQNSTINNLKSELEGAIKDRDRVYKELHDIKKINTENREMVICKLRKERDKAIMDFKSLKGSHEILTQQRNHYKGLSEKLECANKSLRYDLNALKYDFVKFDSNDILHRVYGNLYVVDDGKHVKGFIVVNKKYTEELTNVMAYYTFKNIFIPKLMCYGGDKLFSEFTLPKAHYELAVYTD